MGFNASDNRRKDVIGDVCRDHPDEMALWVEAFFDGQGVG